MTLSEQRAASLGPFDILARFRLGQDTQTIAQILRVPEPVIVRQLELARDLEWWRKQEVACAAWNASLKPVEVRE